MCTYSMVMDWRQKKLGGPDCELDSKKEKLQAIADELGVEINFP